MGQGAAGLPCGSGSPACPLLPAPRQSPGLLSGRDSGGGGSEAGGEQAEAECLCVINPLVVGASLGGAVNWALPSHAKLCCREASKSASCDLLLCWGLEQNPS